MTENYDYIKTTQALEDFCTNALPDLLEDDFLTIDTEFIRERTYAPQLCLIQIATKDQAAIVDPLAPGMDLQPLLDVLANPDIITVFHAARQDLEIFLDLMGDLPKNVFDTQVAAMVCGFGESAGYETLVNKITRKSLDKSSRFSNWAQRPLTKKQLDYAIGDVTYLRDIYIFLQKSITKSGREPWIIEETTSLLSTETYLANPMRLMLKLKLRTSKPRILARALALVEWREERARTIDKPRRTTMRDEIIIELATQTLNSVDDFRKARGLKDRPLSNAVAKEVLTVLEKANALPEEQCPHLPTSLNESAVDPLVQDVLRLLLRYSAEKQEVAEKILASSKDITALIRKGEKADVHCLQGWRREIFGQPALDILAGKLSFSLKDGKIVLTTLS